MTHGRWSNIASAVDNLPTTARRGVAIHRIDDNTMWEINGNEPFPAASTIKLAILVSTARALDAGQLSASDVLPIAPASRVAGSGVLTWLSDDPRLTVADLAYLMIAISDNTASNALIDALGDERIHDDIVALGLTGTKLNRRFIGRVPRTDEGDNFTTASDLVRMLTTIAGGTAASDEQCRWMRGILALQQQRDRLARALPAGVEFAGKSGSLPGIVHDTALLTGPNGTLAVAVLTREVDDSYAVDATMGRIGQAAAELIA